PCSCQHLSGLPPIVASLLTSALQPLFFLIFRRPLRSTLFPYTTLFRSWRLLRRDCPLRAAPWPDPARRSRRKPRPPDRQPARWRSEEHTSELQSRENLVCRLLLEKKKIRTIYHLHNKHTLNARTWA